MKIGLLIQKFTKTLSNSSRNFNYQVFKSGVVALLFLVVSSSSLRAQNWLNAIDLGSSTKNEAGKAVCTDNAGNQYFTGKYYNTVNFNPGGVAYNLSSVGDADIYVTKYNASGVFQWAISAGSIGADIGTGLVCDGVNLYVVGAFNNTATFGSYTLTSNGGQDIFIAKVDATSGTFKWAVNYGGAGDDNCWAICLDTSRNPYITGNYYNTVVLGTNTLTVNGGSASNTNDIFVAALDTANGSVKWASGGGAASANDAPASSGISYNAVMKKLVVATGIGNTASQTANFGTLSTLTIVGNGDGCILEVDPATGKFTYAYNFGTLGNGTTTCFADCYDANSMDVFITGTYNSNPSAVQSITLLGTAPLPATANDAIFVARYSARNHNFVWAKAGIVSGTDIYNVTSGYGITSDNKGGIYATGSFVDTLVIGTDTLVSAALGDVFVAKFTAAFGTVGYLLQGSGNNTVFDDQGFGVSCSQTGGLGVTGAFASTCVFGTNTLSSTGLQDAFLGFGNVPIYIAPTISINGSYTTCVSGTIASLSYGATTGNPIAYSIVWDSTAHATGFPDLTNSTLPSSSFTVIVPSGITGGPFNGYFIVNNDSASGIVQPFSVTFNPAPVFTSPLTVPSICDNSVFTYTISSSTPGVTFSWSRPAVTGISNPAASDTVAYINEVLNNTTGDSIVVVYVDTLKLSGCAITKSIDVTVYPAPLLNSSTATGNVCAGAAFIRSQSSSATGATITWYRAPSGSNPASSGSGNINQVLVNGGSSPITVTYYDTIRAFGCSNVESFNVIVSPTPYINSTSSPSPICSGQDFIYTATSSTMGASFQWSRTSVSGIIPATGSGHSANINEVLTNTTTSPILVVYAISVTDNGCGNIGYVYLTVDPFPAKPVIATMPPSTLCEGTNYQNFGAATPPPAGITYSWTALNAVVWATGNTQQYSLVNFPNSGDAKVILSANTSGRGCSNNDTLDFTISTSLAPSISVLYYNGSFVCLPYNMTSYQWGYDDASALDSFILTGDINQNYDNPTPDAGKDYWVIASDGACFQKAYYSIPNGITNVYTGETIMKLYPNPAHSNVVIEIDGIAAGSDNAIAILDVTGKIIMTSAIKGKSLTMNVSDLSSGYYMVNCFHNGIRMATSQFIKN